MRSSLRVAWAFFKRDLGEASLGTFVKQGGSGLLTVLVWCYLTHLFRVEKSAAFAMDYFTYSLIGMALAQYIWFGSFAFFNRVKREQAAGALGTLWVTAHPLPLLIFLSGLWDFWCATVNAGIILGVGAYVLNAGLTLAQIFGILGIGLIVSFGMASLGLLLAVWSIAFSRADAMLRPIMSQAMPLLSGVFFPVALLPDWLKKAAWCLPTTHALTLARGLIAPLSSEARCREWWILIGITVGLAAITWSTLHLALRQARIHGRLTRMWF